VLAGFSKMVEERSVTYLGPGNRRTSSTIRKKKAGGEGTKRKKRTHIRDWANPAQNKGTSIGAHWYVSPKRTVPYLQNSSPLGGGLGGKEKGPLQGRERRREEHYRHNLGSRYRSCPIGRV